MMLAIALRANKIRSVHNSMLTVEMTTMPEFHETEETSGGAGDASFAPHKHRYQGRKKWKVHNALQMGEKVILLRCDGGQQYIVLGRWEART